MGLFGPAPKVPNTISDKKMADLRRRAVKAHKDWFSNRAVARRLASNDQRRRSLWS
jgi:hypothetical protein